MSKTILSFDIGIKNLAWCITKATAEDFEIVQWGNFNLLEGKETESASIPINVCKLCSAKAKFCSTNGQTCGKHIPNTQPILKDMSGNNLTKLPAMKDIKFLLTAKGVKPLPKGKDAMVNKLKEYYSIPVPKIKVPHAAAIDVTIMHDAIRQFIHSKLDNHLLSLTEVRLENQPVLKNPVMKTIQILLFATLRDEVLTKKPTTVPSFKLVHAGNKVKGKEAGDKGYKARKAGSESRTLETLTGNSKIKESEQWKVFFNGHKKRSDLADAFCMCLDAFPVSAYSKA